MVSALVLRFGLGAQSLAWVVTFALAPVSGIYYPVDVLPGWLQPVALALPSSHVFEGMRAVLVGQGFHTGHFLAALALNLVYIGLGASLFIRVFHLARKRGLLLHSGE
jgi:ABC-2 type transport system permease protein